MTTQANTIVRESGYLKSAMDELTPPKPQPPRMPRLPR